MRNIIKVAALGVALAATPVAAETDTGDMNVTATIIDSCSLTMADISFGTALTNVAGGGQTQTATVELDCTNGAGYTVTTDDGDNAVAAGGMKRMTDDGTNYIPYTIEADGSSDAWSGTAGADPISLVVLGTIDSSATNVPAGDYSDIVTFTVTF